MKNKQVEKYRMTFRILPGATALFFLLIFQITRAQNESALHKIFGGPGFEEARDVVALPDGGYAVIGTTSSTPDGGTDIFLMKLDNLLYCEWTKRYGGAGVDNARALAVDPDGNYVLCGFANSTGDTGYDAFIIKADSDGNELWSLSYGGEDWDFANDVAVDADGTIAVCGETYSNTMGSTDGFVLVADTDGTLLQEEKFGYSGSDVFNSLLMQDGNIYVGGSTDHFSESALAEGWLLGLDLSLQSLWEYHLDSGGESSIYSVKSGLSGLMACGYHRTQTYKNALALSFNSSGAAQVLVDGENLSTPADYAIRDIVIWSDGFMLGGTQNAFGAGGNDIMLQERALSGAWVIGHTLGQGGNEEIYSINITPDEGIILAGVTYSYFGTSGAQAYVIHLSSVNMGTFYTNTFIVDNCIDFTDGVAEITPSINAINVQRGIITFPNLKNEKLEITVVDAMGKTCIEKNIGSGDTIDMSSLNSGLYVVNVFYDQGLQSYKIQHFPQ